MIKAPIVLQDLRQRLYAKAKADASWHCWARVSTGAPEVRLDEVE